MDFTDKVILGLIEDVELKGSNDRKVTVPARIDTGAQNSSISQELAAELQLGPILKNKTIRQAQGKSSRPVVEISGSICGVDFVEEFTISDRAHMRYKVLIGQNILEKEFIIDPTKNTDKQE